MVILVEKLESRMNRRERKGELGAMEVWNGAEVHEDFGRMDQNREHNDRGRIKA